MIKKILISLLTLKTAFAFYVGVGEFTACSCNNKSCYYKNCPFEKRKPLYRFFKKEAPNVNSFSVWITRNWRENWYPAETVNKFIRHGYTPIFIFYWFADDISPSFVKKNKQKYFSTLNSFAKYLQKIKGKVIVILNPEYNENGMHNSRFFDFIQAESILILKKRKNTSVGICPGDFGNYDLLWDEQNWETFAPSMKISSKLADFIAFQEMRALTKNKKHQIKQTPLRALAFATYLHKKYKKPTFLAYLAVSSYKDENLQAYVFKKFAKLMPLFKHTASLIGFNVFHYIDVPNHKGFFSTAEQYFGLKTADGMKKPSFNEFLKIK
ncbi:hypothetical protein [Nautilia sp.]